MKATYQHIHTLKTSHTIEQEFENLLSRIFRLLYHYKQGLNIRQVAQRLKIDKSCASARINELRKFDEIYYGGRHYRVVALHSGKDTITRKTVTFWGVEAKVKAAGS